MGERISYTVLKAMISSFKKSSLIIFAFILYPNFSSARPCSQDVQRDLLLEPKSKNDTVYLSCSPTIKKTDTIKKKIIIEGNQANNITVDCSGGTIGTFDSKNRPARQIEIRSKLTITDKKPTWEPVSGVKIINCKINGQIRIWGMAKNGQGKYLLEPSRNENFTSIVQNNAPRDITLDNLTINIFGTSAIYLSPGSHNISIINSRITGFSKAPTVYLDTETYNNKIENNIFNIKQLKREVIAVDGSYSNIIKSNKFENIGKGAIFLYRNCGEGGVIRHSTPNNNLIIDNIFKGNKNKKPVIFVGSRQRIQGLSFCDDDNGYIFGSSIYNGDLACNNTIAGNKFINIRRNIWLKISEFTCSNSVDN